MKARKLLIIFVLFLITSLSMGCAAENETQNLPGYSYPVTTYPADKLFGDFYRRLGGEGLLGPCLSPAFEYGGIYYQYTSAVVMVYDPNAPSSFQRYRLAPLGLEMGISDPPNTGPERDGYLYMNGHRIWEEVIPLYGRFGGNIVGVPLTGVLYNPELRRYEQYFENMGFFRLENDPNKTIRLLAYGAWKCDKACSYVSMADFAGPRSIPEQPSEPTLRLADDAMNATATRLGLEITGFPISKTYLALDSKFEKIYEYLVLIADVNTPTRPYVRPLAEALHIPPDSLESENPNMYFYPIQGDQGYNVPKYFMDFITEHGSMEVSGLPVTREYYISQSVTRQCFTNLCLEHHPLAPASLRVRPAAQGYIYKDINYRLPQPTAIPSIQSSSLKTWEANPLLPSGKPQVIYAAVYDNNTPVNNIELRLTLTMPKGEQVDYSMPSTDESGQSSVELKPIEAENGTLVPYKVCVVSPSTPQLCESQAFVIWNTP
jgi:hypothetical protein